MLTFLDVAIGFTVTMTLYSLVVTVFVQAISALLNSRGRTLLWGVDRIIGQAVPELAADVRNRIARATLKHPTIAVGFKRFPLLATAVRPEELVAFLREVAEPTKTLGSAGWIDQVMRRTLRLDDRERLRTGLAGLASGLTTGVQTLETQVKSWFETVMDRTTERFTWHARGFTLLGAILVVVVMRVDSVALWNRLTQDPTLRMKLVQMADSTLARAESIVGRDSALATYALRQAKDSLAGLDSVSVPDGLVNRSRGLRWIGERVPPAARDSLRSVYSRRYNTLTEARIGELTASARQIGADLATVELMPSGPWELLWLWDHRGGCVLSIALLSMGAPFWFGVLKQLSGLRPIVATKEERARATTTPQSRTLS